MSQCGEKPSIRIAKIRGNMSAVESMGNVTGVGSQIAIPAAAVLPTKDMVNVLGETEVMPATEGVDTQGSGELVYEPSTGGQAQSPAPTPLSPNAQIPNGDISISPDGIYENPNVLENAPSFKVPANPLLPPEYKEVLNYNDIQFLNGFIRTQIGRYIRVECLVGSNNIETRAGYLIGVGLNYILLQESITGNVISIDFWSIKFVYYYYNEEEAERALAFGPLLNSPLR